VGTLNARFAFVLAAAAASAAGVIGPIFTTPTPTPPQPESQPGFEPRQTVAVPQIAANPSKLFAHLTIPFEKTV